MFTGKKKALRMIALHARYIDILRSVGTPDPDSYRSWKLKEKLKEHFGGSRQVPLYISVWQIRPSLSQ